MEQESVSPGASTAAPDRAIAPRRAALWVVLVGAALVVIGVLLQAFSIAAFFRGAGEGALDMHSANSLTVHLGQVLVAIGAIWAWRRNWRAIALAIAFLALSFFQLVLVGDTDKSGDWVHGLHGLLAIVVLLAALVYGQVAARKLSLFGRE